MAIAYYAVQNYVQKEKILKEMITKLEADTRVAEIVVTDVRKDKKNEKTYTTIKFLEYDVQGHSLEPKYFTFTGQLIQFQSLVIRFQDHFVRQGDQFKGRSAYLFWKAFHLDGSETEEFTITPVNEVPRGYRLYRDHINPFEQDLWQRFWDFAFQPELAQKHGVKSVQVEAPGTKFIPGHLYTIRIEHDGGLRIDIAPIPEILKGETLLAD
jgi:hypothetical protein